MNTNKKDILLLALVIILTIVFSKDTHASYYNYTKGDDLFFRYFTVVKTSMEGTSKLIVDTDLEIASEFTQRITRHDSEAIEFDLIFNLLNVNKFDRLIKSDRPEKWGTVDRKKLKDELQLEFTKLIDTRAISMTIDQGGQIVKENFSERVRNITNIDLVEIGRQLVLHLPPEELIIGTKWTQEADFMFPPPVTGESFPVTIVYEVVGEQVIEGYDCLIIKVNTRNNDTILLSEYDAAADSSFIDVSHVGFSYMYFSRELGHLIRSLNSQTLNITIYLEDEGKNPLINNVIRTEMDSIITFLGSKSLP